MIIIPMIFLLWLTIRQQQRINKIQQALELMCQAMQTLHSNDVDLIRHLRLIRLMGVKDEEAH